MASVKKGLVRCQHDLPSPRVVPSSCVTLGTPKTSLPFLQHHDVLDVLGREVSVLRYNSAAEELCEGYLFPYLGQEVDLPSSEELENDFGL